MEIFLIACAIWIGFAIGLFRVAWDTFFDLCRIINYVLTGKFTDNDDKDLCHPDITPPFSKRCVPFLIWVTLSITIIAFSGPFFWIISVFISWLGLAHLESYLKDKCDESYFYYELRKKYPKTICN